MTHFEIFKSCEYLLRENIVQALEDQYGQDPQAVKSLRADLQQFTQDHSEITFQAGLERFAATFADPQTKEDVEALILTLTSTFDGCVPGTDPGSIFGGAGQTDVGTTPALGSMGTATLPTFNIPVAGSFDFTYTSTNQLGSLGFRIFSGTAATGVAFSGGDSGTHLDTTFTHNVALPAGDYTVEVYLTGGASADSINVTYEEATTPG